jgi:hypothetical protein
MQVQSFALIGVPMILNMERDVVKQAQTYVATHVKIEIIFIIPKKVNFVTLLLNKLLPEIIKIAIYSVDMIKHY